ncbi:unnamed protein product [Moneuplotes crassus]|uniref:Uncharacterized protein n=1 Tax=Euplotes crassus TaxID=5936 RepID=A0AAD1X5Y5_EUPCR|nr:unnamed protein product [Moneuplotes crassus]
MKDLDSNNPDSNNPDSSDPDSSEPVSSESEAYDPYDDLKCIHELVGEVGTLSIEEAKTMAFPLANFKEVNKFLMSKSKYPCLIHSEDDLEILELIGVMDFVKIEFGCEDRYSVEKHHKAYFQTPLVYILLGLFRVLYNFDPIQEGESSFLQRYFTQTAARYGKDIFRGTTAGDVEPIMPWISEVITMESDEVEVEIMEVYNFFNALTCSSLWEMQQSPGTDIMSTLHIIIYESDEILHPNQMADYKAKTMELCMNQNYISFLLEAAQYERRIVSLMSQGEPSRSFVMIECDLIPPHNFKDMPIVHTKKIICSA